jgi:hypothetical protein
MSNIVVVESGVPLPEKKSHPSLGKKFETLVSDFAANFPVHEGGGAARYPVKLFDQWLARTGHLTLPPMMPIDPNTGEDLWRPLDGAKCDAWVAHTHRRYQLLQDLNKAAGHTRVRDELGLTPFNVTVSHGNMVVREARGKIVLGDLPREIESVLSTKKTKVMRLVDSADFSILSEADQRDVENLILSIGDFERVVNAQTVGLKQRFDMLRGRLERAIRQGAITPVNGGIRTLLAAADDIDIEDEF